METISSKKRDTAEIEKAGMEVIIVRNNDAYSFISKSAKNASKDYGVKSVSLLAQKK